MEERHGYGPYTSGCRCDVCRRAKADYMWKRRAQARSVAQKYTSTASGGRAGRWDAFAPGSTRHVASGVSHGTRYAYEERGCRCRECTTARTVSDRRYAAH